MTICKLAPQKYVRSAHGHGIHGRYYRVMTPRGYGLVDTIGKNATKMLLGSVGKSAGSYYGRSLGKWVGDKTGSALAGKMAKAAIGSLAGLAGSAVGNQAGKLIGNTVFSDKAQAEKSGKKAKKSDEKMSLNQLLDSVRSKVAGNAAQSGSGLMLRY
jgi:hypothetical protein